MSITENINDDTSFDSYKGPTTLEVKNPAAERSPASENSCIESKNDCATETETPEY